VSVAEWSDDFLDSLRTQADPAADAVVAGLFEGTADAPSAFRALVVQHNEVADPALAAFLEAKDDPPDWVDRSWSQPGRSGSPGGVPTCSPACTRRRFRRRTPAGEASRCWA
jgi:hypothetical protein